MKFTQGLWVTSDQLNSGMKESKLSGRIGWCLMSEKNKNIRRLEAYAWDVTRMEKEIENEEEEEDETREQDKSTT